MKNHQFERLNDQLLQRESSEASLKSKKKDLKQSLNQLNDEKHKMTNEKLDLERDNQELTRRSKTVVSNKFDWTIKLSSLSLKTH